MRCFFSSASASKPGEQHAALACTSTSPSSRSTRTPVTAPSATSSSVIGDSSQISTPLPSARRNSSLDQSTAGAEGGTVTETPPQPGQQTGAFGVS